MQTIFRHNILCCPIFAYKIQLQWRNLICPMIWFFIQTRHRFHKFATFTYKFCETLHSGGGGGVIFWAVSLALIHSSFTAAKIQRGKLESYQNRFNTGEIYTSALAIVMCESFPENLTPHSKVNPRQRKARN